MKRTKVDDLRKKWMKDPEYQREYKNLEEEFSLIAAMIEARSRAGLTQEQVARRMKTTQAVIADWKAAEACPRRARLRNTPRPPEADSKSRLKRKWRSRKLT